MAKAEKPATKPGAKPAAKPGAKPAEAEAEATKATPGKSKKKLVIIVILLLLIGGAVAALLFRQSAHAPKHDEAAAAAKEAADAAREAKNPPTFVDLGTFTANLVREDGDRYLQVAISLKLSKPELADKIKANSPEILHRVNMLLQSKRPSDIATFEGKDMLSKQIKGQIEYVMGMRKTAPAISSEPGAIAPAESRAIKSGIVEVLFTSFIIQ
ncbi:MAG: flagellar basal body-associated FliL family protein [Gallionellaceae bacterium]|nr:flagellar basal body-associated FliL family protein [Gallionellaceae bacterium]